MACRSEMSVKKGPVTLLSVVQTANKLRLLIAEAESVPGPILEIGNTNSRYRFPVGARRFIEGSGMRRVQHINARWVGHIAAKLKKLASLLHMDCV
jgi:L-arabinose isomerase